MKDKTPTEPPGPETEDDLAALDPAIEEALSELPPGRYAISVDGDIQKIEDPEVPDVPAMPEPHPILGAMITEPALLEFSAEYDDLINALAEAQAEFDDIPKSRTGKVSGKNLEGKYYEYQYQYADISDVLKEVRPKLAKRGIVITQQPVTKGQQLKIVTMLIKGHQWMRNELVMPLQNPGRANPNQVLGGQITYLRRYSLCAMVGVQAEEDLDSQESGADATGNQTHRVDTKQTPTGATESVSEMDGCINAEQQQQVKDALAITGLSVNKVVKHIAETIGQAITAQVRYIPADQFDLAMEFINAQADQKSDT